MVNLISKLAIGSVVFFAIVYQFFIKNVLFDVIGVGRKVQSITEFRNVRCERIDEPGLEACEDMWFHEKTGFLYLACSTLESRIHWLPAVEYLDASKRSLTDRIAMLDTRASGPISSRLTWLTVNGFPGNNGDGTFNLLGIDFLADRHSNTLRILLVNDRPPLDATGQPLDASKVGANSTIEHFITKAGSSSMQYVRTHAHPLINTPNAITWVSDHSFLLTNVMSAKVGARRALNPIIGGGSVVYCDQNDCKIAFAGLRLPNGITSALDGLIYVAEGFARKINVYSLSAEGLLHQEDEIDIGLPLDNLSIDSEGNIFAATFPQVYKWIQSSKNPVLGVPSAVFRVSREDPKAQRDPARKPMQKFEGEYLAEKVAEDNGSLLPGSSAVVHDPRTGRMFLSGVSAPFIAICETR